MLLCLKGQKIFGYVDGTIKMPAKKIPHSDGTMQPNPTFDIWKTQDNLLLSCINASLTDDRLMQVAQCLLLMQFEHLFTLLLLHNQKLSPSKSIRSLLLLVKLLSLLQNISCM